MSYLIKANTFQGLQISPSWGFKIMKVKDAGPSGLAKFFQLQKFSGLRYEPAYDPHPLKKLPKGYSFLIFDQYFTTISTKEPMDLALTIQIMTSLKRDYKKLR